MNEFRPRILTDPGGVHHRCLQPGIHVFSVVLPHQPDPESLKGASFQGIKIASVLAGRGGGIPGIPTGEHVQSEGNIPQIPGKGADLIQGGGKGHKTVAAEKAVGGFHAVNPAKGRRLPYGSPGIAPQGYGAVSRRHRSCTPSGTSSGNQGKISRIRGGPKGRVFRGASHGKLIHVRLPENHRPRLFQILRHRSVEGGMPVFQHLTATGSGSSLKTHVVLENHRNPAKRSGEFFPSFDEGIQSLGSFQSRIFHEGNESPHLGFAAGYAPEMGAYHILHRELPSGDELGDTPPGIFP